jgi:hypothetical protein
MIAPSENINTIVSGVEQSNSFAECASFIDLLVGLSVQLPNTCLCGSTIATIKAGNGLHPADLRCVCGRHRGWLSANTYEFLVRVVDRFGRPTVPIEIRHSANGCAAEQRSVGAS